jgi:uncharacterized caspase-like protein
VRLRIASLAFVFLLIPLVFLSSQAPAAIPRFALVIGNSNYTGMPRLKNPVNDATDLAAALKRLGFKVTLLTNANRRAMNQATVAFRETLAQDRQSEGVFFFAGHGVQSRGVNYLIPVGADIQAEVDLDDEAVSAQKIFGSLEEARNRVNLVILDACRDNPLPSTLRSSARGLAVVTAAPPETLVLYSTAAGQTASDGEGRNSPFAQALLAHIADAGDVTQTVKAITGEVKRATGGQQTPYVYMGLSVDLALNPPGSGTQAGPPAAAAARKPTISVEKDYGSVAVEADSEGSLFLNGESMGELTPGSKARIDDVEIGQVSVEMRYADGKTETQTAVVAKNEVTPVLFTHAVTTGKTVFRIGDKGPAGGAVFYDKGTITDGWRYLEAAPTDASTGIRWSSRKDVDVKTDEAVGSGRANTAAIIVAQGAGSYAAQVCHDLKIGGFDDWFLPSAGELDIMITNLQKVGLSGFASESKGYWSSSQCNDLRYAWYHVLGPGSQYNGMKNFDRRVRAVRAF